MGNRVKKLLEIKLRKVGPVLQPEIRRNVKYRVVYRKILSIRVGVRAEMPGILLHDPLECEKRKRAVGGLGEPNGSKSSIGVRNQIAEGWAWPVSTGTETPLN